MNYICIVINIIQLLHDIHLTANLTVVKQRALKTYGGRENSFLWHNMNTTRLIQALASLSLRYGYRKGALRYRFNRSRKRLNGLLYVVPGESYFQVTGIEPRLSSPVQSLYYNILAHLCLHRNIKLIIVLSVVSYGV
jgi:hypothetical protein